MTWGKLDDKLHDHRKTYQAGTAAMGLWVMANSWCCDNWRTDGFIPTRILHRFSDPDYDVLEYAKRLVQVGLWLECDQNGEPGYRFHDWEHMRPASERDALGGTFGNHVRWHANRDVMSADCEHCYPGISRDDQQEHPSDDIGGIAPRIAPGPVPDPEPETKTHTLAREPAAKSQTENTPKPFDEFCDIFPGNIQTKRAFQLWPGAVRAARGHQVILDAAGAYADYVRRVGTEPRYIRSAVNWLRDEGWRDELKSTNNKPQRKSKLDGHVELIRQIAEREGRGEPPREIGASS